MITNANPNTVNSPTHTILNKKFGEELMTFTSNAPTLFTADEVTGK